MDRVPFKYWPASRTMYPRSQFLNHDVCDTMTTAAVAPMSNISTRTST